MNNGRNNDPSRDQDPFENLEPLSDEDFESTGPFKKDMLESRAPRETAPVTPTGVSDDKPLPEKDFIQDSKTRARFPFWLWLFLLAITTALVWGSLDWFKDVFQMLTQTNPQNVPFLNVTNRQMSNLLWQFPGLMRAHVKNKSGYLPGFLYMEREGLDPQAAQRIVSAPPDVLFLYHTWSRLIGYDYIPRPIPKTEFQEFLNQGLEWQPQNWPQAPQAYVQMVNRLNTVNDNENLQSLPEDVLPLDVRRAFQGWKNYFVEGPEINNIQPTFGDVQNFLREHPMYARNYWRNIQEVNGAEVAGPQYLAGFVSNNVDPSTPVPTHQLAPFLKVALFNAQQAAQGR